MNRERASGGIKTMSLTITKMNIKDFGIYRDFTWSDSLPTFGQYNLIYGWNGSGKTTLSRIFAFLQQGRELPYGTVKLELSNGEVISDKEFIEWSQRLQVRVFNREFVNNNVFSSNGELGPIFVLGEENKHMQQKLNKIRNEITTKEPELHKLNSLKKDKEKQFDDFCASTARYIKATLRTADQDKYANYHRRNFKDTAESIKDKNTNEFILDKTRYDNLLRFIRSERKTKISHIDIKFSSVNSLVEEARRICGFTIATRVIKYLESNPDVNKWVWEGLELHRKYKTQKCLFCDQLLLETRIRDLEEHFNDEYKKLMDDLEKIVEKIDQTKRNAEMIKLPDEEKFYPDLRNDFRKIRFMFEDHLKKYISHLESLKDVLLVKKNNPFRKIDEQIPPFIDFNDELVQKVNEIIDKHNDRVQSHEDKVRNAKEQIEKSIVAENLERYLQLKSEIESLDSEINATKEAISSLKQQQLKLEQSLIEHRRPAEELNQDLANYLGHNEIRFEVSETGYRIMRNGNVAEHLSEGEQTAIAFLYFLKTLEAKDFDKNNGIVVIDDPISSLDSNALYQAFGFMKSQVKDVGQLFVLTHNFLFFRQVKHWFNNLKKYEKSEVRYYMLEVTKENENRKSRIVQLDPLLKDFETEYHYLFFLVYQMAKHGYNLANISQYHYLPNVARRLLEAFLEFKVPGSESLYRKIDEIKFDDAKKTKILRFCDTHSHNRIIDDIEQDPVILGEGPYIAKDIMDLIKEVDNEHYTRMVKLISSKCNSN